MLIRHSIFSGIKPIQHLSSAGADRISSEGWDALKNCPKYNTEQFNGESPVMELVKSRVYFIPFTPRSNLTGSNRTF